MQEEIRIMFTSVGRRVELMQAFRAAAERLPVKLVLYGADISDSAPAMYFCDRRVKICRIDDPDYIPQLLSLCKAEKIQALIPTIDTDLLLLSRNREAFAAIGTNAVISAEEKIRLCRDKRYTGNYFASCGLKSPLPVDDYRKYAGGFPAFIKPKDGSSSIQAYKVHDAEELKEYANKIDEYVVQPFIEGAEYTVDIFCDFDGAPLYITPRRRLAVRSGEVLKTQIANDRRITEECERLVADYKPCGAITVQLIREKSTGEDYYIEINPRFGGGAPLSMKAGADSAEALLRLLRGERLAYRPDEAADGMQFSRFDQSVVTSAGARPKIQAVLWDLDDTLYAEKAYVQSGFRAVAACIPQVEQAYDKLWAAFEKGLPAIDTVLHDAGLQTEEMKSACLRAYRQHTPDIRVYDGVREALGTLRQKQIKTAILTDGRPEGQRAKLQALGLSGAVDEILITDELGGAAFRKPCDIAFRILQKKLGVPFENMLYIGDNPRKDFVAPAMLGMQALWFHNPDGLYADSGRPAAVEEVSSFDDIKRRIENF